MRGKVPTWKKTHGDSHGGDCKKKKKGLEEKLAKL